MNDVAEQPPEGNEQPLTKGERKKLRREEKQREKEQAAAKQARQKLIKRVVLWGLPVIVIGGIVWAVVASPERSDDDVVSRRGIHWHPRVSITINGEQRDIPGNIGIGGVHKDIHTHELNDTLHVELNRTVRRDDIRLSNFFTIEQ